MFVTTAADNNGFGTLRSAMNNANMQPGFDQIVFAIGQVGTPAIITLSPNLGPLPPISGGLVEINGNSQGPQGNTVPYVQIHGAGITGNGITVEGAGSALLQGLSITGFNGAGIALNNPVGTLGSTVFGCYIGTALNGTDTGQGNSGDGISITGPSNTIGSATSAGSTVIAGNGGSGVSITGGTNNVVRNSYIGVDKTGQTKLANGGSGVRLAASNNTIGESGKGNVISGNTLHGVQIVGGSNNKLIDNYIGVTNTGLAAQGNTLNGVYIGGGSVNNEIFGASVISANGHNGVNITEQTAAGNKIYGAYIGTTKTGNAALPNLQRGVNIDKSPNNHIGGAGAGQGNVISGNVGDGIAIRGAEATFNSVVDNYIGLNAAGTAAVANTGDGIEISANNTTIGVADDEVSNVISGNEGCGIRIEGSSFTVVVNNYIGTNAGGTAAFGNSEDGIFLDYGSLDNEIGGPHANKRNVVSGNGYCGVRLRGSGTGTNNTRNTVAGNYVGLGADGVAAMGNQDDGVHLERATANTIGGAVAAARNYIAGNGNANGEFGVNMGIGAAGNTVRDNTIGKTRTDVLEALTKPPARELKYDK